MDLKLDSIKVVRDKTIIDNLSLEIASNEFCVIVGPSGCGKSTLLETISGLISPNNGTIQFNGDDITSKEPKDREIGYVFQDYALYPNMTVFENIEFGLKINKVKKTERKQLVSDMINKMELNEYTNKYSSNLSGGQKQRVAIARALILKPKVLLLDEPLSSLDANLRNQMRSYIKHVHNENNLTSIFVTHDQSEALSLADKLVVMNDGVIQQVGTPREVYHSPTNLFVLSFFNSDSLNIVSKEQAKNEFEINSNDNVYIRANDISVIPGNDWQVVDIQMQGVNQMLTLKKNDITLTVIDDSKHTYNINDKLDVKIEKCFSY